MPPPQKSPPAPVMTFLWLGPGVRGIGVGRRGRVCGFPQGGWATANLLSLKRTKRQWAGVSSQLGQLPLPSGWDLHLSFPGSPLPDSVGHLRFHHCVSQFLITNTSSDLCIYMRLVLCHRRALANPHPVLPALIARPQPLSLFPSTSATAFLVCLFTCNALPSLPPIRI